MRLADALRKSREATNREGPEFHVKLVAGCSALTLSAYLGAHLSERVSQRRVQVSEAPYGDIVNSLVSAFADRPDGLVLLLEYATVDPRLGARRASGWKDDDLTDILKSAKLKLAMILSIISGASNNRTVVHPPSLPLLPVAPQGSWQIGQFQASLSLIFAEFFSSVAGLPGVFIATPRPELALEGRNVDGELAADFPYTQAAASFICQAVAAVLAPPPPLKGIITDLDDTLWRGLVGEIGHDAVHWTLDGKSQLHAVYQQFLAACASRGILVGVVSKNEQKVVDRAFGRSDILLTEKDAFPIIANWQPKSQAVREILLAWNIGADAVVFVDDNEYELDEVARAFPTMATRRFPTNDANAALQLTAELRDLCFKETASEEDKLRLASLRNSAVLREGLNNKSSMEEFLKDLKSSITLDVVSGLSDRRVFELVNKTNQFNLNGRRYTEGEWADYLSAKDRHVLSISYSDKFGELGKIGAVLFTVNDGLIVVDQWVLSCRAFARRIEFATLSAILGAWAPAALRFSYKETEKNGPITEFLSSIRFKELAERPEILHEIMPPLYADIRSTII